MSIFGKEKKENLDYVAPGSIADPLAQQTKWFPLIPESEQLKTQVLYKKNEQKLQLRTMGKFRLIWLGLVLLGLAVGITFFYMGIIPMNTNWFFLITSALGGVMILIGLNFRRKLLSKATFNKENQYFWRGGSPRDYIDTTRSKSNARFEDIYAVQVVTEENVDGEIEPHASTELNLVLNSGERINLLKHTDSEEISKDAKTIADFLEIPLWKK